MKRNPTPELQAAALWRYRGTFGAAYNPDDSGFGRYEEPGTRYHAWGYLPRYMDETDARALPAGVAARVPVTLVLATDAGVEADTDSLARWPGAAAREIRGTSSSVGALARDACNSSCLTVMGGDCGPGRSAHRDVMVLFSGSNPARQSVWGRWPITAWPFVPGHGRSTAP